MNKLPIVLSALLFMLSTCLCNQAFAQGGAGNMSNANVPIMEPPPAAYPPITMQSIVDDMILGAIVTGGTVGVVLTVVLGGPVIWVVAGVSGGAFLGGIMAGFAGGARLIP